jgi:7-carboxy-7-deazaguanine synthase
MLSLQISEIFISLQGESSRAGVLTTFVRLTGCPLRCKYCDSTYAYEGGETFSLDEIVKRVDALGARCATVTGGEPLNQSGVHGLLKRLCDQGYSVSLETGGSLSIADVDSRVDIVLDVKTPGSGESAAFDSTNIQWLKPNDQVKWVITSREDYQWARDRVLNEPWLQNRENLFSAANPLLPPKQLAEWIIEDRLPVRFQLQLHKIIWPDQDRGR